VNIDRRLWLLCGAGAASGTGLGLSFAADGWGWLAWFALVPLLIALRRASVWQAFAAGFGGGLVAAVTTFGWLSMVPAFGGPQFIALGSYVALYLACWCAGVALIARQCRSVLVFAPLLWVALEFVRNHAGFLALPIASLGQSQQAYPAVLQIAALGGEASVTWLVVLGNCAIAALFEHRAWRAALAAGATIAVACGAGVMVLRADESRDRITVAAVQPNIGLHERDTAAGRQAVWQRLEQLTLSAAAQARPELIVWPEGAVGDPRHDAELAGRLAALAAAAKTTLIVGSSETEKFVVAGDAGTVVRERDAYNSAYLVQAGAPIGEPYRKRRLMPFGEYIPLDGLVSWPRWLVPPVAQGRPGAQDADFHLARPLPLRLGVVICWENLFADLSRDAARGGAHVLLQMTNDAWFGPGRAATQHNAASVLRAVENGVPLVLASNAGPSLLIDAQGRIVARTASQFALETTVAQVTPRRGLTLYTRFGDWFATLCCTVALGGCLVPRRRKDRFVPSTTVAIA